MVTDHDGLEPGACRTWDYQRENQAVPGELGQAGRTARVWRQPTKASCAAPSGDRGDICWAPADGRRAHVGNGSAAHRVRAVLASPPVAPSSDADTQTGTRPVSPRVPRRASERPRWGAVCPGTVRGRVPSLGLPSRGPDAKSPSCSGCCFWRATGSPMCLLRAGAHISLRHSPFDRDESEGGGFPPGSGPGPGSARVHVVPQGSLHVGGAGSPPRARGLARLGPVVRVPGFARRPRPLSLPLRQNGPLLPFRSHVPSA